MTSLRQIESNRRNALKSTGPTTTAGKDRSRRNAIRHGMCAETVIAAIEDKDDYQAFEAAVTADYDVSTAVERELVLRLASLLWRLRRATAIETGLLDRHAEHVTHLDAVFEPVPDAVRKRDISQCFSTLEGSGAAAFERVCRYETALWRQLRQTLFALQLLSWQRDPAPRSRAKIEWWRPLT
jgi:glycerol-3-phosphate dehydrogenase